MEKVGLGSAILRFARNVCITVGCMVLLAGLTCLPAAWRTFYHLGNRVMLLAGIVLLVAVGGSAGRTSAAGDSLNVLPLGRRSEQHIKQHVADSRSSLRFEFAAGLAGGIALLAGIVIRRVGLAAMGL
jgi:hypothetical protein